MTGTVAIQEYVNTNFVQTSAVGNSVASLTDGKLTSSQIPTSLATTTDVSNATTSANSYADNAVSTHSADTTSIHGIADTSALATKAGEETLTNKTISLASNTVSGTIAQFNTAVSDADLATLAGSETLTNKTISGNSNNITVKSLSSSDWSTNNPVLLEGEIGVETDTLKFKIGNGSNWNSITTYANVVPSDLNNTLNGYLEVTDLGDTVAELVSGSLYIPGTDIIFEGTDDTHELTLVAPDVTIDKTITLPDATTTLVGTDTTDTLTNKTIDTANNTITVQVSDVSDLTASAAELNILDGATLDVTELNYLDGVTSSVQTQLDDKLSKTGGTMTGAITLHADPTQALHAATKQYVDNSAEGLLAKPAVDVATTQNLVATYDNGTSGVGATLTIAATATLDIDGKTTWAQYDAVLVKNQTNAYENGRYILITVGDGSTAWVFRRCGLCDEASEIPGAYMFVTDGTLNGQTSWVLHVDNPSTFVVGTDDIDAYQFSGAGTYTAGSGLELNGTVFSIDTATTADLSTAQTFTNKTLTSPKINENVELTATATELNALDGITVTSADLNQVAGLLAPVQTQLDAKADLSGPTFSGNVTLPSTTTIGNVSGTEIGYLDGVTSALQTQLNSKTPEKYTFTTVSSGLTLNSASHKYGSLKVIASSGITITVPNDNTDNGWAVGDYVEIYQYGAGQVTIAGEVMAAITTVNSPDNQLKTRVRYSAVTLIKIATDEWLLVGDTAL